MKDFLKFSKRLELSEKIDDYLAETGISINTLGVITTLSSLGLLNVEACKKYLDDERETVAEADKRFKEHHERMTNGDATTEEIVEYMKLAEEKYK